MNLGSKIPVPEVDELRMARMERAVLAQVSGTGVASASSRAHWGRVAVGMVAVAGVVLAIALNLRATQTPQTNTSSESPLPTLLATGPGESDRLMLGDAAVDVEENTNISVQRFADGRTLILLESGSVHCEVQPRPKRPSFVVRAGDVDVTVIGTGFDVARDKTVTVAVQHGIVSVATSHETLRLHAGETWQGSPSASTTVASLLADETGAGPGTAPEGQSGSKDPVAENSEGAHKGQHKTKRHERRDRDAGLDPDTVKLSKVLSGANPIQPVVQPSHGAAARELMKAAASNPAKAVVALEALGAKSTGHEASFALYSRAYLLFFKLGKRTEVVRAAEQYDQRFPHGHEAEDMLWLRVRASCDSSDYSSSCRAAAHTYRRRYPQGVFQGLAARIIRSKKTE